MLSARARNAVPSFHKAILQMNVTNEFSVASESVTIYGLYWFFFKTFFWDFFEHDFEGFNLRNKFSIELFFVENKKLDNLKRKYLKNSILNIII